MVARKPRIPREQSVCNRDLPGTRASCAALVDLARDIWSRSKVVKAPPQAPDGTYHNAPCSDIEPERSLDVLFPKQNPPERQVEASQSDESPTPRACSLYACAATAIA